MATELEIAMYRTNKYNEWVDEHMHNNPDYMNKVIGFEADGKTPKTERRQTIEVQADIQEKSNDIKKWIEEQRIKDGILSPTEHSDNIMKQLVSNLSELVKQGQKRDAKFDEWMRLQAKDARE